MEMELISEFSKPCKSQSRIRIYSIYLQVSLDNKIRFFLWSYISHLSKYYSIYLMGPCMSGLLLMTLKIVLFVKYKIMKKIIKKCVSSSYNVTIT